MFFYLFLFVPHWLNYTCYTISRELFYSNYNQFELGTLTVQKKNKYENNNIKIKWNAEIHHVWAKYKIRNSYAKALQLLLLWFFFSLFNLNIFCFRIQSALCETTFIYFVFLIQSFPAKCTLSCTICAIGCVLLLVLAVRFNNAAQNLFTGRVDVWNETNSLVRAVLLFLHA